jgi:hypothetical protein
MVDPAAVSLAPRDAHGCAACKTAAASWAMVRVTDAGGKSGTTGRPGRLRPQAQDTGVWAQQRLAAREMEAIRGPRPALENPAWLVPPFTVNLPFSALRRWRVKYPVTGGQIVTKPTPAVLEFVSRKESQRWSPSAAAAYIPKPLAPVTRRIPPVTRACFRIRVGDTGYFIEQECTMKAKLIFGAGLAAGYVLGSRAGRAAYENLKARARGIWESPPVQDQVTAAVELVKEKAPEIPAHVADAAKKAGSVIGSALHPEKAPGTGDPERSGAPLPRHSDVTSDPALNDQVGQDWTDEGGATPSGAAPDTGPEKHPGDQT